jgi:hypothetical protein
MFEYGNAHYACCDKTIRIRWEAGNPNWYASAIVIARQAHAKESPQCGNLSAISITPET